MAVRESAEIAAICRRFLDALVQANGPALSNLYSRKAITTYIGSDEQEFWTGSEIGTAAARYWADVGARFGIAVVADAEIDAHESGDVGWALIRGAITFIDDPVPFRISLVLALEEGVWRIVQQHNSIPIDNEHVVGARLKSTLDELLADLEDPTTSVRAALGEGLATIMFTDIEDSTKLAARLGDREWSETVLWHDGVIAEIVAHNNGQVVKTLGDGAMVAFSSTRAAAHAARSVHEALIGGKAPAEIRARIGLHVGDVIHTEDDYLGAAVNKAARIAAQARGGETLVSDAVRVLLGGDHGVSFGDEFETSLKGLEGIHRLSLMR